jgi:RNA polymerase sigma-70 factor, ECF subfamily
MGVLPKASALNVFAPAAVISTTVNARELTLRMADCRLEAEAGDDRADLLLRAKAGDLQAFDQIMCRHQRQVYSTALRLTGSTQDAQDASQEVFLRLYRNLHRLSRLDDVRPWLYRVTVNRCRDVQRHYRRFATEDLTGSEPAGDPGPESVLQAEQRKQLLAQALTRLADKERAAIVLRDIEGLSTHEVARILGSSEVTVRSQICTARVKLKKFVDQRLRRIV